MPKKPRRASRRKQGGPQVHTVPGNQFYTDAERATVKFSDQIILVQGSSGGTLNNLAYKLNSVFQVNATSASGTPQGVAELSAKYKRYRVENSRIRWRIRLMQPGGTFGSLGVLGVAATTTAMFAAVAYPAQESAILPTSVNVAAVQKYATKRYDWPRVFGTPSAAAPESTVVNPAVIWRGRMAMSPAKLDADPDPKQAGYVAAFGTDPSAISYFVLAFQDVLADATAKGVWLAEIDIEQTIYCFDRIVVADALLAAPLAALTMSPTPAARRLEQKEEKLVLQDKKQVVTPPPFPPPGYVLVKRLSQLD